MKCALAPLLIAITHVSAPADHIVVRALDPEGQPVEGLLLRLEGGHQGSFSQRKEYPRTDAEGRAQVELRQAVREELAAGIAWHVVAQVLAEGPVRARLLDALPSGAELQLHVPSTGRLRGVVRNLRGEVHGEGTAYLWWQPGGASLDARPDSMRGPTLVRFQDGTLLSPPIAVGSDLHLRLALDGEASVSPRNVSGPRTSGEVVSTELATVDDSVLVYHLVDSRGAPLKNWDLHARWTYGRAGDTDRQGESYRPFHGEEDMTTDATGAIRLNWSQHFLGEFRLGELTVRRVSAGDRPHRVGWLARSPAARVSLPQVPEPGPTEAGTLTIAALPLLAAGRVVDEAGAGIAGARVSVRYWHNPARPSAWREEQHMFVLADEGGRFELRAFPGDVGGTSNHRARAYALRVETGEAYLPGEACFELGQAGLSVVLAAAGRLDVEPLCDSQAIAEALHLTLTNEETGEGPWAGPRRLSRGHHRWGPVPAGRYTLSVSTRGTRGLLAEVGGLQVEAGQLLRDPRLCPLDLRGAVKHLVVEVRDEQGQRVQEAHLEPYDDGRLRTIRAKGGVGELFAPAGDPCDVVVWAPGYRPALFEQLSESLAVCLSPAFHVTLRLVGGPEDVEVEGIRLGLRHAEDSPLPRALRLPTACSRPDLGPRGDVLVELPGPGRYDVAVIYPPRPVAPRVPGSSFPNNPGVLIPAHVPIEVREQDGGKILQLDLPGRADRRGPPRRSALPPSSTGSEDD